MWSARFLILCMVWRYLLAHGPTMGIWDTSATSNWERGYPNGGVLLTPSIADALDLEADASVISGRRSAAAESGTGLVRRRRQLSPSDAYSARIGSEAELMPDYDSAAEQPRCQNDFSDVEGDLDMAATDRGGVARRVRRQVMDEASARRTVTPRPGGLKWMSASMSVSGQGRGSTSARPADRTTVATATATPTSTATAAVNLSPSRDATSVVQEERATQVEADKRTAAGQALTHASQPSARLAHDGHAMENVSTPLPPVANALPSPLMPPASPPPPSLPAAAPSPLLPPTPSPAQPGEALSSSAGVKGPVAASTEGGGPQLVHLSPPSPSLVAAAPPPPPPKPPPPPPSPPPLQLSPLPPASLHPSPQETALAPASPLSPSPQVLQSDVAQGPDAPLATFKVMSSVLRVDNEGIHQPPSSMITADELLTGDHLSPTVSSLPPAFSNASVSSMLEWIGPSGMIRAPPGYPLVGVPLAGIAPGELQRSLAGPLPGQLAAQLTANLVGQLANPLAAQLMGNLTGQLPSPLAAQLPRSVAEQLPGPLAAQLPGSLAAQLPGSLTAQLPGSLAAQLPGSLAGQLSGPLAAQLHSPLTAQLPGNLAEQFSGPIAGRLAAVLSGAYGNSLEGSISPLIAGAKPLSGALSGPSGFVPAQSSFMGSSKMEDLITMEVPASVEQQLTPTGTVSASAPASTSTSVPAPVPTCVPDSVPDSVPASIPASVPASVSASLDSGDVTSASASDSPKQPSHTRENGEMLRGEGVHTEDVRVEAGAAGRERVSGSDVFGAGDTVAASVAASEAASTGSAGMAHSLKEIMESSVAPALKYQTVYGSDAPSTHASEIGAGSAVGGTSEAPVSAGGSSVAVSECSTQGRSAPEVAGADSSNKLEDDLRDFDDELLRLTSGQLKREDLDHGMELVENDVENGAFASRMRRAPGNKGEGDMKFRRRQWLGLEPSDPVPQIVSPEHIVTAAATAIAADLFARNADSSLQQKTANHPEPLSHNSLSDKDHISLKEHVPLTSELQFADGRKLSKDHQLTAKEGNKLEPLVPHGGKKGDAAAQGSVNIAALASPTSVMADLDRLPSGEGSNLAARPMSVGEGASSLTATHGGEAALHKSLGAKLPPASAHVVPAVAAAPSPPSAQQALNAVNSGRYIERINTGIAAQRTLLAPSDHVPGAASGSGLAQHQAPAQPSHMPPVQLAVLPHPAAVDMPLAPQALPPAPLSAHAQAPSAPEGVYHRSPSAPAGPSPPPSRGQASAAKAPGKNVLAQAPLGGGSDPRLGGLSPGDTSSLAGNAAPADVPLQLLAGAPPPVPPAGAAGQALGDAADHAPALAQSAAGTHADSAMVEITVGVPKDAVPNAVPSIPIGGTALIGIDANKLILNGERKYSKIAEVEAVPAVVALDLQGLRNALPLTPSCPIGGESEAVRIDVTINDVPEPKKGLSVTHAQLPIISSVEGGGNNEAVGYTRKAGNTVRKKGSVDERKAVSNDRNGASGLDSPLAEGKEPISGFSDAYAAANATAAKAWSRRRAGLSLSNHCLASSPAYVIVAPPAPLTPAPAPARDPAVRASAGAAPAPLRPSPPLVEISALPRAHEVPVAGPETVGALFRERASDRFTDGAQRRPPPEVALLPVVHPDDAGRRDDGAASRRHGGGDVPGRDVWKNGRINDGGSSNTHNVLASREDGSYGGKEVNLPDNALRMDPLQENESMGQVLLSSHEDPIRQGGSNGEPNDAAKARRRPMTTLTENLENAQERVARAVASGSEGKLSEGTKTNTGTDSGKTFKSYEGDSKKQSAVNIDITSTDKKKTCSPTASKAKDHVLTPGKNGRGGPLSDTGCMSSSNRCDSKSSADKRDQEESSNSGVRSGPSKVGGIAKTCLSVSSNMNVQPSGGGNRESSNVHVHQSGGGKGQQSNKNCLNKNVLCNDHRPDDEVAADMKSSAEFGDKVELQKALAGDLARRIVDSVLKKAQSEGQVQQHFALSQDGSYEANKALEAERRKQQYEQKLLQQSEQQVLGQVIQLLEGLAKRAGRDQACTHLSPELHGFLMWLLRRGPGSGDPGAEDPILGSPVHAMTSGSEGGQAPGGFLFQHPPPVMQRPGAQKLQNAAAKESRTETVSNDSPKKSGVRSQRPSAAKDSKNELSGIARSGDEGGGTRRPKSKEARWSQLEERERTLHRLLEDLQQLPPRVDNYESEGSDNPDADTPLNLKRLRSRRSDQQLSWLEAAEAAEKAIQRSPSTKLPSLASNAASTENEALQGPRESVEGLGDERSALGRARRGASGWPSAEGVGYRGVGARGAAGAAAARGRLRLRQQRLRRRPRGGPRWPSEEYTRLQTLAAKMKTMANWQ